MKITGILNAHNDTDLVLDTLDSAHKYLTNDILMIIDGAAWQSWGKDLKAPVREKIAGFYHNHPKAPYRNLAYALKKAIETSPDSDWFCYFEPDVLFTGESFKSSLEEGVRKNAWCLGNNFRNGSFKFSLIERMFDTKFYISKYLLGCCVFYHRNFLSILKQINFFDKFLYLTNSFDKGFFPDYERQGGYDFGEHLFPTLAQYLGGNVYGLGTWDEQQARWGGEYKTFTMRWKPELREDECFGSILHPIKDVNSPIREHYRNIRRG